MEVVFEHGGWRTNGIQPIVGPRQGWSLNPLVFRRVMEDLVAEIREDWSTHSCGFWVDPDLLQVLALADDA